MTVTQQNHNQTYGKDGKLVSDVTVTVDVTADAVTFDLASKARTALTANAAFLALPAPTNAQTLAQVQRLTRESNALIRLLMGHVTELGGADLLLDNSGT